MINQFKIYIMDNLEQKNKNYKFQNQFPNNNQNTQVNRIKSLYTTIIKASNSNKQKNYYLNNEMKYIEKSSSRAQRDKKINQPYIFSFEDDEKRTTSFNKTTYIKTDENDKSPSHVKYIYTVSNNETPKSKNKILNVKVQERKNYFSNNIKINKENFRYSTSLNNHKSKNKNIIYNSNKNISKSKSQNRRNNESQKNIFSSCTNFENRNKKSEKIGSQKTLLKNKQKIIKKLPNYKKRHSEIKSFSLSQNQKTFQYKSKQDLNSSSKKNINQKNSNNTSNTSININKNNKNPNLKRVEFHKTISSNLHHYNYTTLSTRIKSSISTLSSTNSSSSLNKYYKCPIVPFSAIKQKIFSNTSSNQKNNSNKTGNYILTDSTNNSKITKKLINYSVISITIFSNWGNKDKVGITEIQLLDGKDRKIPISECHVFNGNEEHIGRIHNNKYHTLNDRDMWTSNFNKKYDKYIKIEMYVLSNQFTSIDDIKSIIFWNYNGRELNKGIKEIEICKRNNKCWRGIIPKGEYNIKSDYSFKINLFGNETLSRTLTNNKSYKRNLYLSLLKQSQISQSNLSQSDNNNNSNILYNEIKSERKEGNNYLKFNKIRIKFLSNYGHYYFTGITGLNLIDKDDKIIDIEKEAISIGALPKDVRTVYNNSEDNRVFENAFNNINNTIDENEMWLTVKSPKPFLEIIFQKEMTLSKIKIWNYNEPYSLDKGVKEIEIVINDEKIYKTILWKGLGIDYYDYFQTISLIDLKKKNKNKHTIDFNIKKYPIGFIFKIILIDNYGDKEYISLNSIEFYDKNNINLRDEVKNTVISETNDEKMIYSYQFYDYKKDEFSRSFNLLFVCFEEYVQVKYIKISNNLKRLSQNANNIQIYCDDILYFEGPINQTGDSIISFEDDYKFLNNNIKKSNIISLNSINLKKQNTYEEIINNGIYMLILDKNG